MNKKTEIWLPVKGYEGLYQVSSLGRVRTLNYRNTGTVKEVKASPNQKGYMKLSLHKEGIKTMFLVHRLVADAFITNLCEGGWTEIDHINGNVKDNRVENLRWVSSKENINYVPRLRRRLKAVNASRGPVEQYDLNGNFVREWKNAAEASRSTGICAFCITGVCRGLYKTAGGYVWKRKRIVKK